MSLNQVLVHRLPGEMHFLVLPLPEAACHGFRYIFIEAICYDFCWSGVGKGYTVQFDECSNVAGYGGPPVSIICSKWRIPIELVNVMKFEPYNALVEATSHNPYNTKSQ